MCSTSMFAISDPSLGGGERRWAAAVRSTYAYHRHALCRRHNLCHAQYISYVTPYVTCVGPYTYVGPRILVSTRAPLLRGERTYVRIVGDPQGGRMGNLSYSPLGRRVVSGGLVRAYGAAWTPPRFLVGFLRPLPRF
jgi:hypothetical protein